MPNARLQSCWYSWRKSTYSLTNGECVEVATACCEIVVRDSSVPDGGVLSFRAAGWRAFIAAIKTDG